MTASNASEPQPPAAAPEPDPGDLVPVFVTCGVRTSAGPGPGVKLLPPAEASAIVAVKYAVGGDQPPGGWPG